MVASQLNVAASGDGSVLAVYVTPRAGRTEVAGVRAGALWVRLAAPPVDGAANAALVEYLARQLDVPRSAISLLSGATGRQKRVRITGLPPNLVISRLGF